MAGYDVETKSYKVPSLTLKLGHSLNKCAKIMRSEATVCGTLKCENAAICEKVAKCEKNSMLIVQIDAICEKITLNVKK